MKGGIFVRVGIGYDAHKLEEGYALILGGVDIPHEYGLVGHSDADCLTHAVMDALFGAAALGDIGKHFPASDEKYRGISSLILLGETKKILHDAGFRVNNIDATIVAQRPKLAEYIEMMRDNISRILGIDKGCVGVKATTSEWLGFEGREEGISAYAVCTII